VGKETERLLNSTTGNTASIDALENPLDFIAEDHMREREVCALIDKLVSAASLQDADIDQMLTFLEDHLPQHLADEEIDLFPMMLERCDPEDEIDKVIDKLHSDHGHALADAPAIIAMIQTIESAAPALSDDDCQQMAAFAHHARRHLILENAVILPIARARLTDGDLAAMKRHMLQRRGLRPAAEND
jgi:hemerythrin-like domain-containing protein